MEFLYQSIITVIIISVVMLLVPKGKCQSVIKWVFSIITTIVIVSPFCKIFQKTNYIPQVIAFQEDYLSGFYQRSLETNKTLIENFLEGKGFSNAEVTVVSTVENNSIKYKKVQIRLKNFVINTDKQNINIINETQNFVKTLLGAEVLVEING